MKRRFLMPLLIGAFALAIGGACKKKEEGAAEGEPAAAKPADEGAKEEAKPDEKKEEAKADEKKEEGGAAASTGVEECDAYMAAVEKYVSCDKVPEQAREATKKGIEQMKAAWSAWDDNTPAEAKKAAADGCKQATDALKKGAEAMGCEI